MGARRRPNISRRLTARIRPALIEDAPMYRATITARRPFKTATAHDAQTQVSVDGQAVRVLVNDIHEIIEIK